MPSSPPETSPGRLGPRRARSNAAERPSPRGPSARTGSIITRRDAVIQVAQFAVHACNQHGAVIAEHLASGRPGLDGARFTGHDQINRHSIAFLATGSRSLPRWRVPTADVGRVTPEACRSPAPGAAIVPDGRRSGYGRTVPVTVFDIDGVLADVRHRLHFLDQRPRTGAASSPQPWTIPSWPLVVRQPTRPWPRDPPSST